jgi:pimeloyl-ACP methyl ester carboxylesterase
MEAGPIANVQVDSVQIVCRTLGKVLNGFAATSTDWDPTFINRLASCHRLILLNNRGVAGSTDDGRSFDVGTLAEDAAQVLETLDFEQTCVLGWSMGGFIAQTLAVEHPDQVEKLILLATDAGGTDSDLASPAI